MHETNTLDPKLEELEKMVAEAAAAGGPERIARQHAAGKMTARERITRLFDPGSFEEIDAFVTHDCHEFGMDRKRVLGDGIVAGHGTIDGRSVYAYAQDFTVFGGSVSEAGARKICKTLDLAMANGDPVVSLLDGSGARLQEGVGSLGGYAEIAWRVVQASGVIPQIAAIMGPCAGGAVYTPSMCDFIYIVEDTSFMFLTGPDVIKHTTNEEVTMDELGGANTHFRRTGVAQFKAANDAECLRDIRRLLSYLPSSYRERPSRGLPAEHIEREIDELGSIIPDDPTKTYDVKRLLELMVDKDSFLEVQGGWARNLVVGFSRIDGWCVGIVATQPKYLAGALDIDASLKGARFIRFCNAFNIPVLTVLDTPGYFPGTQQEYGGIIRHGAKLAFAYAEATVPLITLITRKAYGGAYGAMGSKHMRTDLNFAFPSAEVAVMAPEGAARILYGRELKAAGADAPAMYAQRVQELRDKLSNPYVAARRGYVDAIIKPSQTRLRLAKALAQLSRKNVQPPGKRHGNVPL